jgi:membrane protein DedA with SNARE-associated domain
MSVTEFIIVDAVTAFLTVALFWGGIGLLGDDRIEKLTTGATRMGQIAIMVFLILLAGWIGYKCWKQKIKKIISY